MRVEEKFPKENFRVQSEMREKKSVYEVAKTEFWVEIRFKMQGEMLAKFEILVSDIKIDFQNLKFNSKIRN